jgi:hypothetical protein
MRPSPSWAPTRLGRYDLLARLGAGGAATVYKAVDRASGEVVAVKVMPPTLAANPVARQRFEEEFRTSRLLDHPNIVRALDYQDGEQPFLVMEFVEGESLGDRLAAKGRLAEPEALGLIFQVCDALAEAHRRGVIHRDVKPDNILIRTDGVAKLADLGLVKRAEAESNLTRTGRGLGTPHFMAPEQFRNAKGVDARCDVYSLGATLYMMLTGHLPFQARGTFETWTRKMKGQLDPPRRLVPELSAHVEAAVLRAVSPNPQHRQASCEQFADELRGAAPVAAPAGDGEGGAWLLEYVVGRGKEQTTTGNAADLRRWLQQGRLGDPLDARVGRPGGPLLPLEAVPEFCDVLAPWRPPDGPDDAAVTPDPGGGWHWAWATDWFTPVLLLAAAAAAALVGQALFGGR